MKLLGHKLLLFFTVVLLVWTSCAQHTTDQTSASQTKADNQTITSTTTTTLTSPTSTTLTTVPTSTTHSVESSPNAPAAVTTPTTPAAVTTPTSPAAVTTPTAPSTSTNAQSTASPTNAPPTPKAPETSPTAPSTSTNAQSTASPTNAPPTPKAAETSPTAPSTQSTPTTFTSTASTPAVATQSSSAAATQSSSAAIASGGSPTAAPEATTAAVTKVNTPEPTPTEQPDVTEKAFWPDYKKHDKTSTLSVVHFAPKIPFPYFGSVYALIHAHSNGYVSFNEDFTSPTAPVKTAWTFSPNLFAVYWADIEYPANNISYFYTWEDTSRLDNVKYESSLIKYVKNTVNVTDFEPLYALALTWKNAVPHPAANYPNDTATFQLILATDSVVSYAITNYGRVWANTDLSGRPYAIAAHTQIDDNGKFMSETSTPKSGTGPIILKLGAEKPSKPFDCIQKTQFVKTSLGESIANLPPCACYKVQVEADHRFNLTDYNCPRINTDNNPITQQCCYDSIGYLITNSADAKVPIVDGNTSLQEAHDECCASADSRLCNWFYQQIPSSDCTKYVAPFISAGFGDPHIVTFDGNKYSFNQKGDFVLFKSGDGKVQLQGRTNVSSNGQTTYFKAYAIVLDGTRSQIYLGTDNTLIKDNLAENSGTVSAGNSDFWITIKIENGALFHEIQAYRFHNDTVGLLGSLDGNVTNDFKFGNDTLVAGPAGQLTGKIINEFVESWRLNVSASVINNTVSSYTATNQSDLPDLPTTVEDVISAIANGTKDSDKEKEAIKICGDQLFCLQDYLVNSNATLAGSVLDVEETISVKKNASSQLPKFQNSQVDILVNISSPLTLTIKAENNAKATLSMSVSIPSNRGIRFEVATGKFTWNISEGLDLFRSLSYPQKLEFYLKGSNGLPAKYVPTIFLCLCQETSQCQDSKSIYLDQNYLNIGNVISVQCNCSGDDGGTFCERKVPICENCYEKNVTVCEAIVNQTNHCPACPHGMTGNGIVCQDIDECADKKGGCSQYCRNIPGGRDCFCDDGYRAHGTKCVEIDECETNYTICDNSHRYCRNTPGSYVCPCLPDLVGDNCIRAPYKFIGTVSFTFEEDDNSTRDNLIIYGSKEFNHAVNEIVGALNDRLKSANLGDFYVEILAFSVDKTQPENSTHKDESWVAKYVIYVSQPNVTAHDISVAVKNANCTLCKNTEYSKFSPNELEDDDANLCKYPNVHRCNVNTTYCIAKDHITHCHCIDGYTVSAGNIYSCDDIDECSDGKLHTDCPEKTTCINAPGHYTCDCGKGQVWKNDKRKCVGDSCSTKPCQNGGSCYISKEDESSLCICPYGWNGPFCADEDTDARRMNIAVISVSSILGFCCLAMFITVVVLCIKQRRKLKGASNSSSDYAEIKPLPRAKILQKSSGEMEEKNGPGNAYSRLERNQSDEQRSSFYSKPTSTKKEGTVYYNNAFEEDVVARL